MGGAAQVLPELKKTPLPPRLSFQAIASIVPKLSVTVPERTEDRIARGVGAAGRRASDGNGGEIRVAGQRHGSEIVVIDVVGPILQPDIQRGGLLRGVIDTQRHGIRQVGRIAVRVRGGGRSKFPPDLAKAGGVAGVGPIHAERILARVEQSRRQADRCAGAVVLPLPTTLNEPGLDAQPSSLITATVQLAVTSPTLMS